MHVKLPNSQFNKLKSGNKNGTEITLKLSSKLIGNCSFSSISYQFPLQPTDVTGNPDRLAHVGEASDHWLLKVLTTKQILQRLPIAFIQVKIGNTSENLPNEIRQVIYYLYQVKRITKKVYDDIMNSIKLQNTMDATFMNSGKNKTPDPHRLLLNPNLSGIPLMT